MSRHTELVSVSPIDNSNLIAWLFYEENMSKQNTQPSRDSNSFDAELHALGDLKLKVEGPNKNILNAKRYNDMSVICIGK